MIGAHANLPDGFALDRCRPMPHPRVALVCPPDYFDVIDVKNEFMEGRGGTVDRTEARRQWHAVVLAIRDAGMRVERIDPTPGCEDMVFCANPALPGLDAKGARVCVLGRMRHASRQREVAAFAAWFRKREYRVVEIEGGVFEGGGDALWHPGRGLLWGGFGGRSDPGVYPHLARVFEAPVLTLEVLPPFYHLDTCLCLLDEETALVHPPAFRPEGLRLLRRAVPRLLEADPDEARARLACNAAAFLGTHVVVPAGCPRTSERLRTAGFRVLEVETGEFLKSGGSVYCMKSYVF